jgi:hypothetical protein
MKRTMRDALIVSLTSALIRMESDKLTVGQTADLLIALLQSLGFTIKNDDNE